MGSGWLAGLALGQNGRVTIPNGHGENERLDLERTSPGLLFLLCTGLRTLLRLVVTSRQPCRLGDRRSRERVYHHHNTRALALRKGSGQEKRKDSPPQ